MPPAYRREGDFIADEEATLITTESGKIRGRAEEYSPIDDNDKRNEKAILLLRLADKAHLNRSLYWESHWFARFLKLTGVDTIPKLSMEKR